MIGNLKKYLKSGNILNVTTNVLNNFRSLLFIKYIKYTN